MELTFNVLDWLAVSRTEEGRDSVLVPTGNPNIEVLPKRLPMMLSRRMSLGSRFAVECALELLERHAVDAIVNASRHAETPRGEKSLCSIAQRISPSPTDFTMSVHNAAAGILTIHKKLTVPVTSVAAEANTFETALFEAASFLCDGKESVLLLDYENTLPPILGSRLPAVRETFAVAMLLQKGSSLEATATNIEDTEPETPDVLQFIEGLASKASNFTVRSGQRLWTWRVKA